LLCEFVRVALGALRRSGEIVSAKSEWANAHATSD
jgi:hypothetical protein